MTNTVCPDHTSHEENVAEAMGFGDSVPADHFDEWQAAVDAEIAACEGH